MSEEFIFNETNYVKNPYSHRLKPIKYKITEKGCWVVTNFFVTIDGYTHIIRDGKRKRSHRYVYETVYKTKIPDDKVIRHKCNNPTCINPEHLEVGSQFDNVRDMMKSGNIAKGKKIHTATLTSQEYQTIIKLIKEGNTANRISKLTGRDTHIAKEIAENTHWSCKEYDPERDYKLELRTVDFGDRSYIRKVDKELYFKVIEMKNNGSSLVNISRTLGLGKQTVSYIVNGKHPLSKEYGK